MKTPFPGALFPSAHRTVEKAHGRHTTRSIITLPSSGTQIDFPHAAQIGKIRRARIVNGKKSVEVVYAITSLPRELADEHQLLAHNRNHWSIENKLHLPRDTTYREDHSRIRKHHGARNLAILKNLAIGLHAVGRFDTKKSPCKSIPKMNRKLARRPQIAIKFCITPCGSSLMQNKK